MISKPPVARTTDWPLLKGIWRVMKAGGKAVLLAFLGMWVFGLAGAAATFYCYFIGVYVGIPLGLAAGLLYSPRVSAKDVLFTFSVSVCVWLAVARYLPTPQGDTLDQFLMECLPTTLGALTAVLVFAARNLFPARVKQYSGVILGLMIAAYGVSAFLIRIYS